MADPRRTSALAGLLPGDRPDDAHPGITLRAVEGDIKLTLRGSPEVAQAVATMLGLPVADTMLAGTGDGSRRMLRLGPDEWLLALPSMPDLSSAVEGRHHALVDISERLPAVELSGPASRDVLAGGCPLDLHGEKVAPGFASRTIMGKADIVLECREDGSFVLHTNRSFLEYLWLLLVELGREFGVKAA